MAQDGHGDPGHLERCASTPLRKLWVNVQRVATSMRRRLTSRCRGCVGGSEAAGQDTVALSSSRGATANYPTTSPLGSCVTRPSALGVGLAPEAGTARTRTWEVCPAWVAARAPADPLVLGGQKWGFLDPPKRGFRDPQKGGSGILNNVNFGGFHRS